MKFGSKEHTRALAEIEKSWPKYAKTPEECCMHDGCDRLATRFEEDAGHWHDWIWCDEHDRGRSVALEVPR